MLKTIALNYTVGNQTATFLTSAPNVEGAELQLKILQPKAQVIRAWIPNNHEVHAYNRSMGIAAGLRTICN